jgi:hypothetical protein
LLGLLSRLPAHIVDTRVSLTPLGPDEVRELVASILALDDVSDEFAVYRHERTLGVRRGLRKALELAGFEVEAMTPILRDHCGPPRDNKRAALGARAMYALGARGRSAAARARPAPS